jgi:hypothetical protein
MSAPISWIFKAGERTNTLLYKGRRAFYMGDDPVNLAVEGLVQYLAGIEGATRGKFYASSMNGKSPASIEEDKSRRRAFACTMISIGVLGGVEVSLQDTLARAATLKTTYPEYIHGLEGLFPQVFSAAPPEKRERSGKSGVAHRFVPRIAGGP